METLGKDIKHAWRMFRENKLFTATAIAALTLGIGVNIAIFSVVNAVLLKPVPFPEPDTLVQLVNTNNGTAGGPAASPAKYMHWRAQTEVLESVAAVRNVEMNLEQGDVPEAIAVVQTSAEYFGAFRPPLAMGRWFTAEETLPNGGYIAVLSYNFWTQRLGSDPNVLGKSVTLSGNPYTVVGVVGREFDVRDFGRRPRSGCRSSSIRTRRTRATTSRRSARLKPRRLARAGASAAHGVGSGISRPLHGGRDVGNRRLQRNHAAGVARTSGASDAARRARRRRLRAADRVRQRREPAPDPCDWSPPRARRARRARRGPLAHHAAAADRKPDVVVRGRRARPRRGLSRHARVADREHGRLAAAR